MLAARAKDGWKSDATLKVPSGNGNRRSMDSVTRMATELDSDVPKTSTHPAIWTTPLLSSPSWFPFWSVTKIFTGLKTEMALPLSWHLEIS